MPRFTFSEEEARKLPAKGCRIVARNADGSVVVDVDPAYYPVGEALPQPPKSTRIQVTLELDLADLPEAFAERVKDLVENREEDTLQLLYLREFRTNNPPDPRHPCEVAAVFESSMLSGSVRLELKRRTWRW
jgi:hypothetical protein